MDEAKEINRGPERIVCQGAQFDPDENPFHNPDDWYERMRWDQIHGWADYS
jgi:hypothetical protein